MARKSSAATAQPVNGVRRSETEEWLEDNAVTWTFEPEFPLADIDHDRSLANQAREVATIPGRVEEYQEALQRGERLPAIVVARRGKTSLAVNIDGNHRYLAALGAEQERYGAYVVNVQPGSDMFDQLTHSANAFHGQRTTEDERVSHAVRLIEHKQYSVERAAAAVNATASRVRTRWDKIRADKRAAEQGIRMSAWRELPPTTKTRLLSIGTDEGFKAATRLTIAAQLATAQVDAMLAELAEHPKSAKEQERIVRRLRIEYHDRIEEVAAGGVTSARSALLAPNRQLRMTLGNLLAMPEDLGAKLGQLPPEDRKDTAQRARQAAERLMSLAAELETS